MPASKKVSLLAYLQVFPHWIDRCESGGILTLLLIEFLPQRERPSSLIRDRTSGGDCTCTAWGKHQQDPSICGHESGPAPSTIWTQRLWGCLERSRWVIFHPVCRLPSSYSTWPGRSSDKSYHHSFPTLGTLNLCWITTSGRKRSSAAYISPSRSVPSMAQSLFLKTDYGNNRAKLNSLDKRYRRVNKPIRDRREALSREEPKCASKSYNEALALESWNKHESIVLYRWPNKLRSDLKEKVVLSVFYCIAWKDISIKTPSFLLHQSHSI